MRDTYKVLTYRWPRKLQLAHLGEGVISTVLSSERKKYMRLQSILQSCNRLSCDTVHMHAHAYA